MVRSEISKVLVFRLGSLGDTIIALPVLHLIERVFPRADRMMLTNLPVSGKAAAIQQVLDGSGLIHRYLSYPVGLREVRPLLDLVKELRAWGPEVLVYLTQPRSRLSVLRNALFFASCGIREMIGLPLTKRAREWLPMPDGQFEHETQRLARNVAKLGDPMLDDPASWDLRLHDIEIAKAKAMLETWPGRPQFMVATIGTKIPVNDWGSANWQQSLEKISSRYPYLGLALIGSAEEHGTAEIAGTSWRGPKINLCGKLTPRQSAAVIREAVMYAGHDTGPMHLAAAMQVPCVAVFSARNPPGIWFPWGEGHRVIYHTVPCMDCALEVCIANSKKCIMSISPDEVCNAAFGILERRLARLKDFDNTTRINR
jgi:ADP-heptose:LPS heptosyltransferase